MGHPARRDTQIADPIAILGKPANDTEKSDFSELEWSVIRFARQDSISTLHEPGRIGRFWKWLTGRQGSPKLANERLEALRRIAVLSWHNGFTVHGDDVAEFLSAGFSPDQYQLLVTSIWSVLSTPKRNYA